MFELRREAAVAGHGSPAVVEDLHLVSAGIDHGLDGEDHPGPQGEAFAATSVMQDIGRFVKTAADAMARALADVAIKPPASPLVSNVLAAPISDPDEIRRRLIEQVTGTVRWRESVAYMASQGVTRFFEIGAGKVLSGLVKRIAAGAVGVSVSGPNDIPAAKDAMAATRSA